jgi:sec-independent protein translocase protein TatA
MFEGISWEKLLVVIVIILLLFGAKRIPEVMRSLGQGIREFKKSMNEPPSTNEKKAEEAKPPEEKKG